ncbi:hypothetical protein FM112_13875 [Gulosibacter sp. 10]|nr:hypothetical protein FM112_13875 [Gulosibacter sp. 10]
MIQRCIASDSPHGFWTSGVVRQCGTTHENERRPQPCPSLQARLVKPSSP